MELIVSVSTASRKFDVVLWDGTPDSETTMSREWRMTRTLRTPGDPIVAWTATMIGELPLPSGTVGMALRDTTPVFFIREVEDQHMDDVVQMVKQRYDAVVREIISDRSSVEELVH